MFIPFLIAIIFLIVIEASVVPTPKTGLRGNVNYFFYSDASSFNTFQVTVNDETDLVCNDLHGFSIQLNCMSHDDNSVFQQYVYQFGTDGITLLSSIDNYNNNGDTVLHNGTADDFDTFSGTVSAGSTFTISIIADLNNNVDGAGYSASLDGQREPYTDVNTWTSPATPVYGCSAVIVGNGNGETANFAHGSGTIVYSSSSTTFNTDGSLSSQQDWTTVEDGNSVYGPVDSSHTHQITQKWGVAN